MPFGGLLTVSILGGVAAAGGAISNKETTTPTLDPAYSPLQTQVLSTIQKRLQSGLPAGFEEGGVRSINSTFDAAKQTSDQNLVRRGLARSPVAANVDTQSELARTGAVGQFRAGLPLVAQQLEGENLGMATNILAEGRGTTKESGGGAGGALTNLAGMLGYLYKKNNGNGNNNSGGGGDS